MSVTHYNNELGEVVEYEMLDPQSLAEMTPLGPLSLYKNNNIGTAAFAKHRRYTESSIGLY